MVKKKGSTMAGRRKRAQRALDIMVQFRCSDRKIKRLLRGEEEISPSTARHAVNDARKILAQIGAQCPLEERGLLFERADELFCDEKNSKEPNKALLNSILRTLLAIHMVNPNLKGNNNHDNASTSLNSLSPELQNALERCHVLEPGAGADGKPSGA